MDDGRLRAAGRLVSDSGRARVPEHRIAETVAGELRARILADDGPPGYRLPTQDQLVSEFGVSYPSVREAIRILETEGLVTVRRDGRSMIYAAQYEAMNELLGYLTENCCQGRACAPARRKAAAPAAARRRENVA